MDRVGQVLVETYRVERLIAEGGMASVYEAVHLRVPKRFAVKFLKMQWVAHPEALLRFRREAKLIATFDHPGIVQLIDYNVTEDGVPYIVLEFLDGENLAASIARGRLELMEALGIARVVAAALASAHARGVIHRDLKPENIIRIKDGVKVVDFGVAKLRGGADLTAFNHIVGTVAYMAPEQLIAGAIDARTDQFSLAAIVREMISGEHFVDANLPIAEQAMRILHRELPPLEGVPPRVNAAISRAMAKKVEDRFPTITEFLDALTLGAGSTLEMAAVMADVPSETEDPGLPPLGAEETTVTPAPEDARHEFDRSPNTDPDVPAVDTPVLDGPTRQLDVAAMVAPHARITLKPMMRPESMPTMPPATPTMPTATVPPRPEQTSNTRATLKPMMRPDVMPTMPPTISTPVLAEGVRPTADHTGVRRLPRGQPRWVWIAVSAAAAGSVAAITLWLVLR